MARHNLTGTQGEALAATWLTQKNYRILHQNWRYSRWEVDIIAEKEGMLHFIEVKTRLTQQFGYPEDNVDNKKIQSLINASEAYLYQYPQWQRIQFDILSISILQDEPVEYFLIEDVYL